MAPLAELENVSLACCRLTTGQVESFLNTITEQTQLNNLDLRGNKLSNVNPVLLKKLNYLQSVSLDGARPNGNQLECILTSMREQTKLKAINLNLITLSSVDPSVLSALTQVEDVQLINNSLTRDQILALFTAIIGEGNRMKKLIAWEFDLSAIDKQLLSDVDSTLIDFDYSSSICSIVI